MGRKLRIAVREGQTKDVGGVGVRVHPEAIELDLPCGRRMRLSQKRRRSKSVVATIQAKK